jgi:hypothetical protein
MVIAITDSGWKIAYSRYMLIDKTLSVCSASLASRAIGGWPAEPTSCVRFGW